MKANQELTTLNSCQEELKCLLIITIIY